MKLPHYEFIRYEGWKEQFLKDYDLIVSKGLEGLQEEIRDLYPEVEERLLRALLSLHVGGYEKRLEDREVRYWTNWAGLKTYRTFNSFPQLSELELAFLFYAMGKVFVPLLLHERGVKSESFKRLTPEEQERAVMEELEVIWENHLIRLLQIIPFLDLNSKTR
ncbi:MAG: hypothetical protein RMH93_05245 [Aquificaceae bacterium]|nr:hypothetical protein [Aquificaceae bacterium]MCS7195674.1 hypothetical protein [Aquificaceae bacterium]MDW8032932.1 hypothetical protein [Aquificaceae bacterium]MDW8294796.1 hypothetical protein [Aquificaceae bacterium]